MLAPIFTLTFLSMTNPDFIDMKYKLYLNFTKCTKFQCSNEFIGKLISK